MKWDCTVVEIWGGTCWLVWLSQLRNQQKKNGNQNKYWPVGWISMMITASCNTTCVYVRNGCFTCMATQPTITKRKLIRRNDYYCFDDDIKEK